MRLSRAARWRGLAAVVVAVVTGAVALPVPAAADTWSVVPVEGGYQVTLRLDEALPVRDAAPELAVNGQSLGYATESDEGHTLTLLTSDPRAGEARSVQVAWNGVVESRVSPKAIYTPPAQPQPTTIPTDPGVLGPYEVEESTYDLGDTAISLDGLGGRLGELRAEVYQPKGALGRRPLVLFLHGRHSACYDPITRRTSNNAWPCPAGQQPIESFKGYKGPADALASHGYAVVSVSANAVNAFDANFSEDRGALARSEVVMRHLDLLNDAEKGKGDPRLVSLFQGRIDLDNVGFMGHSRGGEGVAKAVLVNSGRAKPYGVRAVLPLAPTDFARASLPGIPTATILPYCDGDVSNQQGQHFYDDSLYADPGDTAFRSSLLVMGTDHNFFNTEWTPGVATAPASDDWSNNNDPVCGNRAESRLSAAEQYAVGTAFIAGFFRLVQGQETALMPLFDGSGKTVASTGRAVVYTVAQAPVSSRIDVATFAGPSPAVVSGAATGAICASMLDRSPQSGLPSCATKLTTSQAPSWTPATYLPNAVASPVMRFSWQDTSGKLTVPLAQRNISKAELLTFRVARDENLAASAPLDLNLTLVDGRDRSVTVPVSTLGPALTALPGLTSPLPKTWLRTVRLPLSGLSGIDKKDIKEVSLTGASETGGVYLADLSFTRFRVGEESIASLPQVSVGDVTVLEGNGPGEAQIPVTLSKPSDVPVTATVQALAAGTGPVITQVAATVTIPAGQTGGVFTVPLAGNTVKTTAVQSYQVIAGVSANATIGDGFARLVVTDDD
ncbi:hypothetical protein Aph01nite_45620 [Acrocarpospora phusangensis]|uniref:Alpha/beta hydrolase n=1 Tax=Acrocarpospora phusangensis TaxID=1070424 RepID=A0A919UPY8_9ACTN|nr:hypothetical protein [Acrocarpospora phusangensis]GIH26252.1 hypothetical protein Aph01nite_45620 [Acrocarpospora phusangensis]